MSPALRGQGAKWRPRLFSQKFRAAARTSRLLTCRPPSPSCCYELACVPCLRFRSSRVDREPVCPRLRWGGGGCGGVWGGGGWAFLVTVREGGGLAVPGALGAATLCAQVFSLVRFSLVTCHVIKCLLFCLETF